MSRATFYLHFRSKAELVTEIMQNVLRQRAPRWQGWSLWLVEIAGVGGDGC